MSLEEDLADKNVYEILQNVGYKVGLFKPSEEVVHRWDNAVAGINLYLRTLQLKRFSKMSFSGVKKEDFEMYGLAIKWIKRAIKEYDVQNIYTKK